jgi:hypothetical protein
LDNSPDGKVYVNYISCDNVETQVSYSYSGTYYSVICAKNCQPITLCWYEYDGISGCTTPLFGSQLTNTYQSCLPINYSCSTCFDYSVTEPNYTTNNSYIELGQSYGNVEVTISASSANITNQIFVGSIQSGYGEVFDIPSTGGTITKTVGYYDSQNTALDLAIYSVGNASTPFQPFTFNICVGCPTLEPCSVSEQLYINGCVTDPANGAGQVTLTVVSQSANTFTTGSLVNVETGLTINYIINGISNTIEGNIIIVQGDYCNTLNIGGFNPDEVIDGVTIVSVTPAYYLNQVYSPGNGFRNFCYSCP